MDSPSQQVGFTAQSLQNNGKSENRKSSAGAMACIAEVDHVTNADQQKWQPDMQVQLRKATRSIDHNPEDLRSIHMHVTTMTL